MRTHPRNEAATPGYDRLAPFLKRPGGKRALAARLLALLPRGRRLIEPFVGAGSIFAASDFAEYLLADANPDLITLYRLLRENSEALVAECRELFDDVAEAQHCYYARRDRFNDLPLGLERAALFVYLNRYGFNGLCRYNQAGRFNVPAGRFTAAPKQPWREMLAWATKLKRAELRAGDFADTLAEAQAGDVVLCDPPYAPLDARACFASYTGASFGWADHVRLVDLSRQLAARGVPVLITNHDTQMVRRLYRGALLFRFEVRRSIGRSAESRRKVPELAALFAVVEM